MSSDYSPFPPGPPIIHRDEAPEKLAPDPEQPSEAAEPPDTDAPDQETDHDSDD